MRRTLFFVGLLFLLIPLSRAEETRPEPPDVFARAPAEEVSAISHPGLRIEMLWMAFEDQEARRKGG